MYVFSPKIKIHILQNLIMYISVKIKIKSELFNQEFNVNFAELKNTLKTKCTAIN